MGLSDVYSQHPWTPATDVNQGYERAFENVAQVPMRNAQVAAAQQANSDAAFTSPSAVASPHRAALAHHIKNNLMAGPPEFQDRLIQELSRGPQGMAQPQGQPQYMPEGNMVQQVPQNQGPQGYQPYQPGNYAPPSGMGGERPVQVNTGGMGGVPMQQPQVRMTGGGPGPQAPQQPEPPMTNYDVDSYLKAGPTLDRARKPVNDPLELERLRQQGRLDLENRKQGGRLTLADVRNGQRSLELGVRNLMEQGKLDETTKYHVEQIALGYAKLEAMASLLDKNLDFKKSSGNDQLLKEAVRAVNSADSSEGALIGSAFATTPEGQKALMFYRDLKAKMMPIIEERLNEDQGPTTSTEEGKGSVKKVKVGGAKGPKADMKDHTIIRIKRNGQAGTIEAWEFNSKTDVKQP